MIVVVTRNRSRALFERNSLTMTIERKGHDHRLHQRVSKPHNGGISHTQEKEEVRSLPHKRQLQINTKHSKPYTRSALGSLLACMVLEIESLQRFLIFRAPCIHTMAAIFLSLLSRVNTNVSYQTCPVIIGIWVLENHSLRGSHHRGV